ncbi:MAG: efflux RND transporter permease subunit [Pseudomonadales bacterium]|nr:efflux RND transporter permease subunit [Pseudomonadales bacterium]
MGIAGRLAQRFINTPLTALLALVALLLGIFALTVTPKEEEPQINVTMANVMIALPGADAHEVEHLVAGPAEQVLARVRGMDHVYSVSTPGMAVLTLQYKVGVSRNDALIRLWDTLQSHRDWLPPGVHASEPLVKPMGIDDVPVLALTLSSSDSSLGAFDLERVAHSLEMALKRVPGTREVSTIGGPGDILRIDMDPDALRAHQLSALQIAQVLQSANVAVRAGSTVRDNTQVSIVSSDFLRTVEDVQNLVVGMTDNKPVYLSEVAHVTRGPDQPHHYVWTGTRQGEQPAVTVAVTKIAGANAVDVANHLLSTVQGLKNTLIPPHVTLTVTRNYGQTAQAKASKLIEKLIFATTSVIILVFFSLGRRESMIVGAAVLLTLAVTLFASWAVGFTLNRVSLFALIFSIGILVDDAIVVVENIHRHRRLSTGPMVSWIPAAVDEVGGPTILATLTVIAALLPMAFVSGLMGPYMSPIPINASMGMLLSLAIAFTITPYLALRWLLGDHGHTDPVAHPPIFNRVLRPFLHPELGRRNRHRLYAGLVILIIASCSLVGFKAVILKMLPFDNKSEFQVVVDLPHDSPVEKTSALLHALGRVVARVPEVTNYQAYAGTASPINFNGLVRQYYNRTQPWQGDLQVNLVDQHERHRSSHAIAQALIPQLSPLADRFGARLKVVEVPPGPPVLSPLVAEIYGPDDAGRRQLAAAVSRIFAHTQDIVSLDDTQPADPPIEIAHIDQARAASLNIDRDEAVQTLTLGLSGMDIGILHTDNNRYAVPIHLGLPAADNARLDATMALTVTNHRGQPISLSDLVQWHSGIDDPWIYHKDLLPLSEVMADVSGKTDSPLYAMFAMRHAIHALAVPHGLRLGEYFTHQPHDTLRQYALKWDGEWQITYETFRDMGLAYGVGMILIYLLVVAQFGSYMVPLVIMMPIPLTVIGILPGHALLGDQFTATSMIGMIALAGIIVRNSILLVDFINIQLADGKILEDAVVEAAATRARPIILTALAAMIGAGFILDDPIFNGLSISLIFGILVSTILTLVVIPVLYYALLHRQEVRT